MKKLKVPLLGLAALLSLGLSATAQSSVGSGFFVHNSSDSCMNPKNKPFNATKSTQVVLKADCPFNERQEFTWREDGKIQHTASGRCVRPEGALNNVQPFSRLKLTQKCNGNKLGFTQLNNGAILHVKSGLCLHPESGKNSPPDGARLILKNNCSKDFTQFSFVEGGVVGDEDGDGVTDDIDQCPGTPAGLPVDEQGCAIAPPPPIDIDLDHIPNSADSCPMDAGPLILNGCPATVGDFDGDGVNDLEDFCPFTTPGEKIIDEGCSVGDFSDDDFDGVFDGMDLCPNSSPRSGPSGPLGCTEVQKQDLDGDGVFDSIDLCPEEQGDPELNGCSLTAGDNDNDGIPDELDECPFTSDIGSSFVDKFGCSAIEELGDSDGDTVINIADACPGTPRFAVVDFAGCTQLQDVGVDTDGDGVLDSADECPNTPPGVIVDGFGCPIDDDRDGVPNQFDLCPNTPIGFEVDEDGCEISQALQILGQNPIVVEGTDIFTLSLENFILNKPTSPAMEIIFEPIGELDMISVTQTETTFLVVDPSFSRDIVFQTVIIDNGVFTAPFTLTVEFIRSGGGGPTPIPNASVIVNDAASLDASGINIFEVFDGLAREGQSGLDGIDLFQQLWDTQLSESAIGSPINCEEINGFPISCDRLEPQIAFADKGEIAEEMSRYKLLAAVNRIELRDEWNDCGEHRLVFGLEGGEGRNFIIIEARVPSFEPGDIIGCEGVIAFWDIMTELGFAGDTKERGALLRDFYINSEFTDAPVISVANFGEGKGQIRTNQFITRQWMLREHELRMDCEGECKVVVIPVRAAENPFGPLFNAELAEFGEGPIAAVAAEFQAGFAEQIDSIVVNDFMRMTNPLPDRFNNGQSHSQFPSAEENDFLQHFFSGGGEETKFGDSLLSALRGRTDALGNPLTVEQLLARTTALTCGGCHEPSAFGLTRRNSIGAIRMPDGSIRDSWPGTLGFVHIDERRNLSPALEQVFLPLRKQHFESVLAELFGGSSSSSSSSSSSGVSSSSTSSGVSTSSTSSSGVSSSSTSSGVSTSSASSSGVSSSSSSSSSSGFGGGFGGGFGEELPGSF